MSLRNIRSRIKAIEDVFMARMSENPFGEKTAEVMMLVYFKELDKLIAEDDNLNDEDFLTITELKKRLAETQLPPKLTSDINKQMSSKGIMSDETLQALTEHLKGEE